MMEAFNLSTSRSNIPCSSLQDLREQLQQLLIDKKTETRAEHISASLEIQPHVSFTIVDDSDSGAVNVDDAASSQPQTTRRTVVASEVVQNQPTEDPVLQKAVAELISGAATVADRSVWTTQQATRGAQGWQFIYLCQGSLKAWKRSNASVLERSVIGNCSNITNYDPILTRPAFDCRGTLTISFNRSSRNIVVKYEHTPLHKTVTELVERLVPAPVPVPLKRARASEGDDASRKKRTPVTRARARAVDGENGEGSRKRRRKTGSFEDDMEGDSNSPQPQALSNSPMDKSASPVFLNVPPEEAERRRNVAIDLLRGKGIDPDTLSVEQFNIFANQPPNLQTVSLEMLAKYGAERLRIVHPDEKSQTESSNPTQAEPSNSTQVGPSNVTEAGGQAAPETEPMTSSGAAILPGTIPQSERQIDEQPTAVTRGNGMAMPQEPNADLETPASAVKPGTKPKITRGRCDTCKSRKVECTKEHPSCSTCIEAGLDCVYLPPRTRRKSEKHKERAPKERHDGSKENHSQTAAENKEPTPVPDPSEFHDAVTHQVPLEMENEESSLLPESVEHLQPIEHHQPLEQHEPVGHEPIEHHQPVEQHEPIEHHEPIVHHEPVEHHQPTQNHQSVEHHRSVQHHQPVQRQAVQHHEPVEHHEPPAHHQRVRHRQTMEHQPVEHQTAATQPVSTAGTYYEPSDGGLSFQQIMSAQAAARTALMPNYSYSETPTKRGASQAQAASGVAYSSTAQQQQQQQQQHQHQQHQQQQQQHQQQQHKLPAARPVSTSTPHQRKQSPYASSRENVSTGQSSQAYGSTPTVTAQTSTVGSMQSASHPTNVSSSLSHQQSTKRPKSRKPRAESEQQGHDNINQAAVQSNQYQSPMTRSPYQTAAHANPVGQSHVSRTNTPTAANLRPPPQATSPPTAHQPTTRTVSYHSPTPSNSTPNYERYSRYQNNTHEQYADGVSYGPRSYQTSTTASSYDYDRASATANPTSQALNNTSLYTRGAQSSNSASSDSLPASTSNTTSHVYNKFANRNASYNQPQQPSQQQQQQQQQGYGFYAPPEPSVTQQQSQQNWYGFTAANTSNQTNYANSQQSGYTAHRPNSSQYSGNEEQAIYHLLGNNSSNH